MIVPFSIPDFFITRKDSRGSGGCYAQGFIVVCVLRFLKYSKISSFVISDNFSLNLSRC